MQSGNLSKYVLLWFLGLYLRLTILIVPPLIPRLEAELGFTIGQSAMATSLPLLLIGAGALVGGWLLMRIGIVATLLLGLTVMAVSSGLRSVPAGFPLFFAFTMTMGVGIALMQTGMPALTRYWLPATVGRAAAVYTNGLLMGELLGAGLTGILVTWVLGDHWLLAFAVWVLPVPLIMLALLVYRPRGETAGPATAPGGGAPLLPDVRDGMLWRLALLLASAGTLYFCGNVFLPLILNATERLPLLDMSLAALNGTQILSSGLLIAFADRLLGRAWPLYVISLLTVILFLGLLWAPGGSIVVVAGAFGFFSSSLLIFALALPAWAVPAGEVPRLTAGVLAIGYTLVSGITVASGWLSDSTGTLLLGFLPVVVLALVAMVLGGGVQRREAP